MLVTKRQRTPKGQSKMDNPEKVTTYSTQCTQHEEKQTKNTTLYLLYTTTRK